MTAEWTIPAPVDLPSESDINIDEATDLVFAEFGWPLIGGPSGNGWSKHSVAQRCAHLFRQTYLVPSAALVRTPVAVLHPVPLQVGALFHTLEALYYGAELGAATALPRRGGLISESLPRAGKRTTWRVPPSAPDQLLVRLKEMSKREEKAPRLSIILEAERLFDVHTNIWGNGQEVVTPLGVEVFAEHVETGYTCRYDCIARVDEGDPTLPPGVVIFERKSAAWIDEMNLEAWKLDGEILGQILCWRSSGMEELFGPLAALVVDIISKERTPKTKRVILPPTLPSVALHARWIKWTQAQIALWRALDVYPQSFAGCFGRYGRCVEFENCVTGAPNTGGQR